MKKNNLLNVNIWFILFILSIIVFVLIGFFIGGNLFCLAITNKDNSILCIIKLSFLGYLIKYSWFWIIPLFFFNQWKQENIINIIKNADSLKIRIREILNNNDGKNKVEISIIEKLLDEEENTEYEIEKFLGQEKLADYKKSTQNGKKEIIKELSSEQLKQKQKIDDNTNIGIENSNNNWGLGK